MSISPHKPAFRLPRPEPSFFEWHSLWPAGWLLLIIAVLLAGCGPAQVAEQPPDPATPPPEVTSVPLVALMPTAEVAESNGEAAVANPTPGNSAGDTMSASKWVAHIGKITFAPEVTDSYQPVNPSLLFSGDITQVHAVFDYSGMSPAYSWERVWLLNDKEVARKTGIWAGPESGVFDYFIDNSGRPLPPGDWVLEIYVEGKLLSLGAFVVENSTAEADITSSQ